MPNSKYMFQVTTLQNVVTWDAAFHVIRYITQYVQQGRLPGHKIKDLEKLAVSQTVLKFPACYGAQSFFSVPTCLSPSRATLIQSYLPSVFRTNTLNAFFSFPTHATCPAHLIILRLIVRILFDKTYKL